VRQWACCYRCSTPDLLYRIHRASDPERGEKRVVGVVGSSRQGGTRTGTFSFPPGDEATATTDNAPCFVLCTSYNAFSSSWLASEGWLDRF